jgi:hypothetical protein
MEDILNYGNRDQLYKYLMRDFGFVKVEEHYDARAFGNFYITLSSKEFMLRYVNDRSYLTIEIAGHLEPSKWYYLSFIKNFIYCPESINSDDQSIDNITRIEELDRFLRTDFGLISDLFSNDNYVDTRQKIDKLLKEQFKKKFPGMINE